MKALMDDDFEGPYESPCYPVENYFALNGDGLLTVCMRVHDKKNRHKITTYDHVTKKVKTLGYIPRHNFVGDVDNAVVCLNDPAFTEGVLGSVTQGCDFAVVLAHSTNLRTLCVFDIPNATCLLERDCSQLDFLKSGPTGIAINPKGVAHGQFKIAVLSQEMEVLLWDVTADAGSVLQLEDLLPSFWLSRYLINPRESAIKFSPDGRFITVLGYFRAEHHSVCILIDPIDLEPFCVMPYDVMYRPMCCIFPCFTKCGSKFAMFSCWNVRFDLNLNDYKLLFFEIPSRMQTLKELCRSSILALVDNSVLTKLPLPNDLIAYLNGYSYKLLSTASESTGKQCKVA